MCTYGDPAGRPAAFPASGTSQKWGKSPRSGKPSHDPAYRRCAPQQSAPWPGASCPSPYRRIITPTTDGNTETIASAHLALDRVAADYLTRIGQVALGL